MVYQKKNINIDKSARLANLPEGIFPFISAFMITNPINGLENQEPLVILLMKIIGIIMPLVALVI